MGAQKHTHIKTLFTAPLLKKSTVYKKVEALKFLKNNFIKFSSFMDCCFCQFSSSAGKHKSSYVYYIVQSKQVIYCILTLEERL